MKELMIGLDDFEITEGMLKDAQSKMDEIKKIEHEPFRVAIVGSGGVCGDMNDLICDLENACRRVSREFLIEDRLVDADFIINSDDKTIKRKDTRFDEPVIPLVRFEDHPRNRKERRHGRKLDS